MAGIYLPDVKKRPLSRALSRGGSSGRPDDLDSEFDFEELPRNAAGGYRVTPEEIRMAFDVFDEAGKGHVTVDDIIRTVRKFGVELPIEDVRVMFKQNVHMTLDRLKALLINNEVTDFDPVAEAFSFYDVENTGLISSRQIRDVMQSFMDDDLDDADMDEILELAGARQTQRLTLPNYRSIASKMPTDAEREAAKVLLAQQQKAASRDPSMRKSPSKPSRQPSRLDAVSHSPAAARHVSRASSQAVVGEPARKSKLAPVKSDTGATAGDGGASPQSASSDRSTAARTQPAAAGVDVSTNSPAVEPTAEAGVVPWENEPGTIAAAAQRAEEADAIPSTRSDGASAAGGESEAVASDEPGAGPPPADEDAPSAGESDVADGEAEPSPDGAANEDSGPSPSDPVADDEAADASERSAHDAAAANGPTDAVPTQLSDDTASEDAEETTAQAAEVSDESAASDAVGEVGSDPVQNVDGPDHPVDSGGDAAAISVADAAEAAPDSAESQGAAETAASGDEDRETASRKANRFIKSDSEWAYLDGRAATPSDRLDTLLHPEVAATESAAAQRAAEEQSAGSIQPVLKMVIADLGREGVENMLHMTRKL